MKSTASRAARRALAMALLLAAAGGAAWGWLARDVLFDRVDTSLAPTDVEIDFWHGPVQRFGVPGRAQAWINVLGDVQPARQVAELSYAVDGGPPRPLAVGSDLHRLAQRGDFNIELGWDEMAEGVHTVAVTARFRNGIEVTRDATVQVAAPRDWPLPWTVDFARVANLQDVVQVVDGRWRLEADGVRIVEPYFDRLLVMGDTTWTDYDAAVRLTVHGFTPPDPDYEAPTYGVTHIGVALRWRGHHDDGRHPRLQWYPLGAQGEFLARVDPDSARWRVLRDQRPDKPQLFQPGYGRLEVGTPMWLRAQVRTLADGRSRYRFKQWADHDPEPEAWDVEVLEDDDLPSGSLGIVPHHTDVTVHEVRVVPLPPLDAADDGVAPAGVALVLGG